MSTPVQPSGHPENLILTIPNFSSDDGRLCIQQCLRNFLPFDPHDFQLEGVCKALDGIDLIAITATGDGKTGYFYMYIIAAIFLSNNPSLCPPGVYFPKDPALVVICPTNSIEEQMEEKMKKLGLDAVAINTNTLHEHRRKGVDLWESVTTGVSMIMISPEQLTGAGFQRLLDDKSFWSRVIGLGADEIHLFPAWGVLFRKAYEQVALMRVRFPDRVVAIGVTATMALGNALDTVRSMLGMRDERFHCIRRSNFRPELQLLLRDLGTGINGRSFPALLWILKSNRKMVIYCATISLAFRVTCYLWINTEDKTDLPTRLRMYTAINFPTYNEATRHILYDDPQPNITVATAAMAQGIDAPDIQDVVIVGEVADPDEAHQRWGRAGRDRQKIKDPRGIMYLTSMAVSKAKTVLKGKGKKSSKPSRSGPEMTEGMAQMILAACLSAEQDRYYGNPRENSPCGCETCSTSPPPTRSATCNCSCCIPEGLPPPTTMRVSRPSLGEPLHRALQDAACQQLISLRYDIWRKADEFTHSCTPSAAFLPDLTITCLIDNFSAFATIDSLRTVIASNYLLVLHVERLFEALSDIRNLEPLSVDHCTKQPAMALADNQDVLMGVGDAGSQQSQSPVELCENEDSSAVVGSSGGPSDVAAPSLEFRPPKGIPAHMCISWDAGIGGSSPSSSKRRASKPASQRNPKKGRTQNKENGNS